MNRTVREEAVVSRVPVPGATVFPILFAISFCHLLNDTIQSLIPAIYPLLKTAYQLDFGQIGLITLAFQLTASLLQPVIGTFTDRRPLPYSLAVGMGFTLVGLVLMSRAGNFSTILVAASLVGIGSSVFHPESSRVARIASGGRHSLAQSVFQVGGNAGQAIGPLLAAFIVVPAGQSSLIWFSAVALLAIAILSRVGAWYRERGGSRATKQKFTPPDLRLPRKLVTSSLLVLLVLIFSKNIYTASLTSYYTFYLIERFGVGVQNAQILLFVFMAASALGILIGGMLADRFGRRRLIMGSIIGVLPFTLILPYADLTWTAILSVVIGLISSSAFTSIVVYGQELVPGRVGMIAGLFFGLSFGMAGLGAAVLGHLADLTSIGLVYQVVAWLPAIGLICVFLPDIERMYREQAASRNAGAATAP